MKLRKSSFFTKRRAIAAAVTLFLLLATGWILVPWEYWVHRAGLQSAPKTPSRQDHTGRASHRGRFGDEQKIEILMHEYDGLRAEIVNRTNHGFELLAIGGTVVIWLLTRRGEAKGVTVWRDRPFWFCIVLAVLAIGVGKWITYHDIANASARIRQIEADVNRRVGEPDLLQWETRWGAFRE